MKAIINRIREHVLHQHHFKTTFRTRTFNLRPTELIVNGYGFCPMKTLMYCLNQHLKHWKDYKTDIADISSVNRMMTGSYLHGYYQSLFDSELEQHDYIHVYQELALQDMDTMLSGRTDILTLDTKNNVVSIIEMKMGSGKKSITISTIQSSFYLYCVMKLLFSDNSEVFIPESQNGESSSSSVSLKDVINKIKENMNKGISFNVYHWGLNQCEIIPTISVRFNQDKVQTISEYIQSVTDAQLDMNVPWFKIAVSLIGINMDNQSKHYVFDTKYLNFVLALLINIIAAHLFLRLCLQHVPYVVYVMDYNQTSVFENQVFDLPLYEISKGASDVYLYTTWNKVDPSIKREYLYLARAVYYFVENNQTVQIDRDHDKLLTPYHVVKLVYEGDILSEIQDKLIAYTTADQTESDKNENELISDLDIILGDETQDNKQPVSIVTKRDISQELQRIVESSACIQNLLKEASYYYNIALLLNGSNKQLFHETLDKQTKAKSINCGNCLIQCQIPNIVPEIWSDIVDFVYGNL